jgi:hypothetical protein
VVCGQATDVARYSTKGLFNEIYNQFRKFDAATTVYTFWQLITRPGQFVREYLAGKRVDYLGPIKYFFYAFLLQITAGFVIHLLTGNDTKILTENTDLQTQIIDLIATAFWGICWSLVYRRSGLNKAENIAAAIYFTAQTFMFTFILRLIFGPFLLAHPELRDALTIVDMTVYLVYSFFFAHRLFHESTGKVIFKQMLLVILYLLIFIPLILLTLLARAAIGEVPVAQ